MRRVSVAWMLTSGHVSPVRVPSTYTSGSELPTRLSLPRSCTKGQWLRDQSETRSCGIARLMASRTVRPGLAESASPVRITLPAVLGGSGLPPGSVERSKGRDVAQPSTSTQDARMGKKRRECSMWNLRQSGRPDVITITRSAPYRQTLLPRKQRPAAWVFPARPVSRSLLPAQLRPRSMRRGHLLREVTPALVRHAGIDNIAVDHRLVEQLVRDLAERVRSRQTHPRSVELAVDVVEGAVAREGEVVGRARGD